MDRYEQALHTVTRQLSDEFGEDLLGLLFAGSAAYGTPMRTSDIDLYVLIRPRWRQRRNELVDGVEVELFINPVEQIQREIEEGVHATVDMFARGRICHDPTGVVQQMVDQAREIAARPPVPPTASERYFIRYVPSDLLRDCEDLVDVDPVATELVLAAALQQIIEAHWLVRGLPAPKPKRALATLREEGPETARLAERILGDELPLPRRVELLRELCDQVLAPVGGVLLEGCTEPEPLP